MIFNKNFLYKFSEKQYVDAFYKTGQLKLGTLWEYREAEKRRGIADSNEGKKAMHRGPGLYISSEDMETTIQMACETNKSISPNGLRRKFLSGEIEFIRFDDLTNDEKEIIMQRIDPKGSPFVLAIGGLFSINLTYDHCNIFSVSKFETQDEFRKAFDQFYRESGYDTCYSIVDPNSFFDVITSVGQKQVPIFGNFLGCFGCHYVDSRNVFPTDEIFDISPILLKDMDAYGMQFEKRAVWSFSIPK